MKLPSQRFVKFCSVISQDRNTPLTDTNMRTYSLAEPLFWADPHSTAAAAGRPKSLRLVMRLYPCQGLSLMVIPVCTSWG